MDFKITASNRGKPILSCEGHEYNVKMQSNDKTYWRCIKYYSLKYKATIITENGQIVKPPNEHVHEVDHGKCLARETLNEMKEMVKVKTEACAMAEGLAAVESEFTIQLSMPPKHSLARNLRRHKTDTSTNMPAPFDGSLSGF